MIMKKQAIVSKYLVYNLNTTTFLGNRLYRRIIQCEEEGGWAYRSLDFWHIVLRRSYIWEYTGVQEVLSYMVLKVWDMGLN